MKELSESRRKFLKAAGLTTGAVLLSSGNVVAESRVWPQSSEPSAASESNSADYTLHVKTSPVEIARKKIISATTYNGQFPGPLLRFKEDQRVTGTCSTTPMCRNNCTGTARWCRLMWMEPPRRETPFIPEQGKRGIVFTPRPAGFRFYHTHNRAGSNLYAGQYGGEVGPVYIEPKHEPGNYDREVFLVWK